MGRRRTTDVKSPGKGGIGHGVRKGKVGKDGKTQGTLTKMLVRKPLGEIENKTVIAETVKMEEETVKPVKEEKNVEEPMKDEDDPEMDGLCEYEKIRLRNIRMREALFAELGLKVSQSIFHVH